MSNFADGTELGSVDKLEKAKLIIASNYYTKYSGEEVYATVEKVWADIGASLWWQQIVIHRGKGGSFQINGNTRAQILRAINETDIACIVLADIASTPQLYQKRGKENEKNYT